MLASLQRTHWRDAHSKECKALAALVKKQDQQQTEPLKGAQAPAAPDIAADSALEAASAAEGVSQAVAGANGKGGPLEASQVQHSASVQAAQVAVDLLALD